MLDDHNKRVKVQEKINLKENMACRYQDIVEVQNWFGPRDPNKAALTALVLNPSQGE